jgi:hypothetical protein
MNAAGYDEEQKEFHSDEGTISLFVEICGYEM